MSDHSGTLCIKGLNRKYPFWTNLVQKISLGWNVISRLIRWYRIQWCYSLFLFLTGNTIFGQIWSKKSKIVSFRWSLVPRLIRTCKIQLWCSLFPFSTWNTLFKQMLFKKSKVPVWAEIWYLDKFEYAEFSYVVHFFCFTFSGNIFFVGGVRGGKFGPKKLKLSV